MGLGALRRATLAGVVLLLIGLGLHGSGVRATIVALELCVPAANISVSEALNRGGALLAAGFADAAADCFELAERGLASTANLTAQALRAAGGHDEVVAAAVVRNAVLSMLYENGDVAATDVLARFNRLSVAACASLYAAAQRRAFSGDYAGAATLLRAALVLVPEDGPLRLELGAALQMAGQVPGALQAYQRAARAGVPEAARLCGQLLRAVGREEEARVWMAIGRPDEDPLQAAWDRIARAAAEAGPAVPQFDDVEASRAHETALRLADAGHLAASLHMFVRARGAAPSDTAPAINAALTLSRLGRWDDALAVLRDVVAVEPSNAVAVFNLGNVLLDSGHWAEAHPHLVRALELAPDSAVIRSGYGRWFLGQARYEEAAQHFAAALRLDRTLGGTWVNLGICLKEMSRLQEAREAYEEAARLMPGDAVPLYNLGSVFKDAMRFEEALHAYERALALRPDFPEAFCEMYHSMIWTCNWTHYEEYGRRFTRIIERSSPDTVARLMQPFYALVLPVPLRLVRPSATAYCHKIAQQLALVHARVHHPTDLAPNRRLRIAYVSSDYRKHAVGRQLSTALPRHTSRVEALAFATEPLDGSGWSADIRAAVSHLFDISAATAQQGAEAISEAGAHIAVNLNGHTKGARTDIFALRPTPVVVNFLGYPSTLGGDFTDFIVTDCVSSPPVYRHAYSEHLLYMPHTYQVTEHRDKYEEPERVRMPSKAEVGLPEDSIVFCSFNQIFRIDPYTWDVWMRLLRRLPRAVLWIVRMPEDGVANLLQAAADRGVAPERIVFADMIPKPAHLRRIMLADAFLDSPVYNGHTTCGDALWAGVPVVTLPGTKMPSRVAASMLQALAVTDTIAANLSEYERIAYALATQPAWAAQVRARIAAQRKTGALFDTVRWMAAFETGMTLTWDLHAASGARPRAHVVLRDRRGRVPAPPLATAVPVSSEEAYA